MESAELLRVPPGREITQHFSLSRTAKFRGAVEAVKKELVEDVKKEMGAADQQRTRKPRKRTRMEDDYSADEQEAEGAGRATDDDAGKLAKDDGWRGKARDEAPAPAAASSARMFAPRCVVLTSHISAT